MVGAGITGLAAAHRLRELAPNWSVVLLEAADRPGGVLYTERCGGYLLEHSADSFLSNIPEAMALCRRVGQVDLIGTQPEARRAYVVRRGRLLPIPEGFSLLAPARVWPLLATPILSWRGKLRVLAEWFVPPRRDGVDESLAEFACRRLGREAFERLVQPLVAGIYTSAAERLSVAAALPRFVELERNHGSVARGLRHEARAARARPSLARTPSDGTNTAATAMDDAKSAGARYGLFVAPRDGLSSLVAAVAARLPAHTLRLGTRVHRLQRREGRWGLELQGGTDLEADALVLAVAAPEASRLLAPLHPSLAAELGAIEYAGTTLVLLGYARDAFPQVPQGSGFVVPAIEKRRILAASFASEKFPGRAPPGRVLVRVFVGGATQPELLGLSDEEAVSLAKAELAELVGIRGEPELVRVVRWTRQMPQYHVGHLARLERIKTHLSELPGLLLAGNAYQGVGIPHCIRSGEHAAEQAVSFLKARSGS